MKKKLLVVGGTGFVGSHIHVALESDYEIRSSGSEVDVRNAGHLREFVASHAPDDVVHLAAITTVGESFQDPETTYQVNFIGTLHLLEALRQCEFKGKVLYVGSSEVYGSPLEAQLPVVEGCPLKPQNPYAVSKMAAEALCYQWSQHERFEIVMARPFNHIGPGQSERFAVSDFARQVVETRLGMREPILRVGDIDVTRDITDVRDVVHAYNYLLRHGKNGEAYNICSGAEYSIRNLVDRLCLLANVDLKIEKDMSRLRQSELRRMRGNNEKIKADTGWCPSINIDTSLLDILDDWERKLK